MMHKVIQRIERPPPELVARFRRIKTEILAGLPGARFMKPEIRPLANCAYQICGPAVTIALDGPDGGLMGVAAMDVVQEGDVVVVSAHGDCSGPSWGGGLTRSARVKGLDGIVIDGAPLDAVSILETRVPLFCIRSTMLKSSNRLPVPGVEPNIKVAGSVNVPAVCGGVAVNPGDLVAGDLDGVLVLPREILGSVIDEAERRTAGIARNRARLENGETLFDIWGGRSTFEKIGISWE